MAIIDAIMFNGEFDLLEIRLNILNGYVDEFIICEAPTTFSGQPKPLYFEEAKHKLPLKFLSKIKFFVINENYTPQEIVLANYSPNTQGANHWKHEFLQKESIKKALIHLKDDDIVFIGDCDEIWNPNSDTKLSLILKSDLWWLNELQYPQKLKLLVYIYYLNNKSNEQFWGTLIGRYKNIKNECLNHLHTNAEKSGFYCGWHFTSLKDGLRRKLTDSYTNETYANDWVMNNLEENIRKNKDFLDRDFKYQTDESDWPQYLKDNKQKYIHLCK